MLKLATRRRVRTGLIGGYGTVAYLAARIALPHVGLLLQIGYAACSRAAYAAMAPLENAAILRRCAFRRIAHGPPLDLGEDWAHLCTACARRIDPVEIPGDPARHAPAVLGQVRHSR